MQEWHLGWEKVSCLERCPQFHTCPIYPDREVSLCVYIYLSVIMTGELESGVSHREVKVPTELGNVVHTVPARHREIATNLWRNRCTCT